MGKARPDPAKRKGGKSDDVAPPQGTTLSPSQAAPDAFGGRGFSPPPSCGAVPPPRRPQGPKVLITAAVIEEVLERISAGESLRRILPEEGRPQHLPARSAFRARIVADPVLQAQYARACRMRADELFDETLEIADDPLLPHEHKRIRVDTRKWATSKLYPRLYGDKIIHEEASPLSDEELDAKIAAFLTKGGLA